MDFTLPRFAAGLERGLVTRWLKHPGDAVERGEPIVEVETEKVNSELESPVAGVVEELVAAEGDVIPVGGVLARIRPDA